MQETVRIMLMIAAADVAILVVVLVAIKKLLLGDTIRAVERVGQAEAEIRKKEESMRQELERHEQENAARRKEAEAEFTSRRDEADRQAAQMREQVMETARRESADILDKARKNERKLRDQVELETQDKAVEFGGRIFKMVFSERISAELNRHFVGELIEALAETDASGIVVDASSAQFISSHPLDPGQKQRLQELLASKFSVRIDIHESVREELLAGLVMKLGSLEIDGSLLSRYQEAVAELKKEAV